MILFRPTGLSELKLVAARGWRAWPPRLQDQPIFYPVLSLEYARRIARDWNTKDAFSGFVGFVTTFRLQDEFAARYPVQLAGGHSHEELWVPSDELEQFNDHIVGAITVLEAYAGEGFTGVVDPETRLPRDLFANFPPCTVRRATANDVDASVALLIASITTLCAGDHSNDPETLAHWLRNKTKDQFERWLEDPENFTVIAEAGSVLCGVANLHSSGTIRLCYVLPGMQRHGVGRVLIQSLEAEARARGLPELNLTSTGSARSFYKRLGFVAAGAARITFGVLKGYPYEKVL